MVDLALLKQLSIITPVAPALPCNSRQRKTLEPATEAARPRFNNFYDLSLTGRNQHMFKIMLIIVIIMFIFGEG